jgi:putative hydrolase of the HAD superfamily
MIEAGGWGVHVPHEVNWALDRAEAPEGHPRFLTLPDLGGLAGLIPRIGT